MSDGEWSPIAKRYAVDTSSNPPRLGWVVHRYEGSVYLRPVGGGTEWATAPDNLRPPTEEERQRIQVLTTPVEAVTG